MAGRKKSGAGGAVWLSQRLIAELYQVVAKAVNDCLVNSYGDGQLDPKGAIRNFRIAQRERIRSQTFFATVQNELHWAIHGRTAAEVIALFTTDAMQPA